MLFIISKYFLFLILTLIFVCQSYSFSLTYTVTNCASGASNIGSLHWAVKQAAKEGDIVEFNISTFESGVLYSTGESYPGLVTKETTDGGKFFRIIVSEPIKIRANGIYINGSTQSREANNNGRPNIELRGTSLNYANHGFELIDKDNCTIEGFALGGFGSPIYIENNSSNNAVKGCYIGLSASGEGKISNFSGIYIYNNSNYNKIGDAIGIKKNVISGNKNGIDIINSSSNEIFGNFIGTKLDGLSALGNTASGINISFGSSHNKIGKANNYNIISANETGIYISDSYENEIFGNYIGVDYTGNSALGNSIDGIYIFSSSALPLNNKIGDGTAQNANVISGNYDSGINISKANGNQISGNYIGTDKNGLFAVPNNQGIYLSYSFYNKIGGTKSDDRNIISGNKTKGIRIAYNSLSNEVFGNFIGISKNGTQIIPNDYGIEISDASFYNKIGSGEPGSGNVISGNKKNGINIIYNCVSNEISGNYIGTNLSGTAPMGNGLCGIYFDSVNNNKIGDGTKSGANTISFNGDKGIYLLYSHYNLISKNSMHDNAVKGISLAGSSNKGIKPPEVLFAGYDQAEKKLQVSGTGSSYSIIELFKAAGNQGKIYLGDAKVENGKWEIALTSDIAEADPITAVQTDINGNSSEFCSTKEVVIYAVSPPTTDTPTIDVVPDDTPTIDPPTTDTPTIDAVPDDTPTIDVPPGDLPKTTPPITNPTTSESVNFSYFFASFGPNPYNPNNGSARIWYWLTSSADTTIYLMNMAGKVVWKQLYASGTNGGRKNENNIEFNGKSSQGDALSDGSYLLKIVQNGKVLGGCKIAIIKNS